MKKTMWMVVPSIALMVAACFPLSYSPDQSSELIDEIFTYVSTQRADDPLIEINDDLWIKSSNVHGVCIGKQTYYFSLAPHMSYDPLTRGDITLDDIAVVYHDTLTDPPVLIYTIVKEKKCHEKTKSITSCPPYTL